MTYHYKVGIVKKAEENLSMYVLSSSLAFDAKNTVDGLESHTKAMLEEGLGPNLVNLACSMQ